MEVVVARGFLTLYDGSFCLEDLPSISEKQNRTASAGQSLCVFPGWKPGLSVGLWLRFHPKHSQQWE